MRTHDAQRAEDARQKATLKAAARLAKEKRIADLWRAGDTTVAIIAEACGVSDIHVADVLHRLGMRKKTKGPTAKK